MLSKTDWTLGPVVKITNLMEKSQVLFEIVFLAFVGRSLHR